MFLLESGEKPMKRMKQPKPHDSRHTKEIYFDMENMRIMGPGVKKVVCPECLGSGGLAWCDRPRPDEYDICPECDGKGEWLEPDF